MNSNTTTKIIKLADEKRELDAQNKMLIAKNIELNDKYDQLMTELKAAQELNEKYDLVIDSLAESKALVEQLESALEKEVENTAMESDKRKEAERERNKANKRADQKVMELLEHKKQKDKAFVIRDKFKKEAKELRGSIDCYQNTVGKLAFKLAVATDMLMQLDNMIIPETETGEANKVELKRIYKDALKTKYSGGCNIEFLINKLKTEGKM